MAHRFFDLAFTPDVLAAQARHGSRAAYARHGDGPDFGAELGAAEAAFIAARDSVYVATVSASGWPYIQHRGGPRGFVQVQDSRTLRMPDFRGNRQYISLGNLASCDKVALFFMDYARPARLKLLGRVSLEAEAEPQPPGSPRAERAWRIAVEAFDWNCQQHIPRRFDEDQVAEALRAARVRIEALEAALARRAD